MALIVVNLTDTFNEWREKTNLQITQVGDLSTLATANSASIVGALNGMMEDLEDDVSPQLGGPLDVNGEAIVSAVASNANITLTPDGTGKVVITKGDYTGSLNTATTATTQAVGNNTTLLATTAFVTAAVQSEDTLEEMNDTTMSGKANLDVLQYDSSGGGSWKNRTMTAAGIPTTGFTVAMAIALG
jgi:hypothetical protein